MTPPRRSKYRRVYAEAAERILSVGDFTLGDLKEYKLLYNEELILLSEWSKIFGISAYDGHINFTADERALALAFAISIPDAERWE